VKNCVVTEHLEAPGGWNVIRWEGAAQSVTAKTGTPERHSRVILSHDNFIMIKLLLHSVTALAQ